MKSNASAGVADKSAAVEGSAAADKLKGRAASGRSAAALWAASTDLPSFHGRVVKGEQIGRTLGYPTANIDAIAKAWGLRNGVYAAEVRIEDEEKVYRAMLNIGARPTFNGCTNTIEAHLLDFSGDLYGKTLYVVLLRKLRGEKRFDDVEALKRQLAKDAEAARG